MTDKLQEQVEEIIKREVPERHSIFQLNFFVIGKEPTHQAKLKKCVEELKLRKRSLTAMTLEIEELRDRNELMKLEASELNKMDSNSGEIRKRMIERKVKANQEAMENLLLSMKNCQEEMLFFVEAFNRLSKIEPKKEWDDVEVQMEYWNAKLSEELNQKILMDLPITSELVQTIMAMPVNTPVRKQMAMLVEDKKLIKES